MTKIPYPKQLISFTDQIELLKQLLIDKLNHIFRPKSTFETAYSLYKFDGKLRKLIIAELEKIEVAVRTQTAYISEKCS